MLDARDQQFEQQRGRLNRFGTIALLVMVVGGAGLFFSSAENRSAVATFAQLMKESQNTPPAPAQAPAPQTDAPAAPSATPQANGLIAPEDARFAKEVFQFIQAPNRNH